MPDQIISKEEDKELLAEDLAENGKAEEPAANCEREMKFILSSLISSGLFKDYALDEKDMRIMDFLFNSLMNGKDWIKTTDILKHIEKGEGAAIQKIKRVVRLRELGIVETGGRSEENTDSVGALLRASIRLSGDFLNTICSEKEKTADDIIAPYKDNLEYLADQFERIRLLKEIKNIRESERRKGSGQASSLKLKEAELKKTEARIAGRMDMTDEIFPFEEFRKKKKLSQKEELIVLAVLGNEIVGGADGSFIDDVLDVISRTPYERLTDKKLIQKDGRLLKEKIIDTGRIARLFMDGGRAESIRLNENLKMKFLGEKKRQRREKFKGDSFFETIKPTVSLDNVVLHPKTGEELSIAIEKIEGNAANLLQEWGIKNNLLHTEAKKRGKIKQPVVMLFHGPPGTGKTLAANATAYKLKRELITVDCSKILGCYVGESEKNTRKIFDKYRAMAKGKKNVPVLLLNEADQFLHRRINASRSTDHMYNQMQNIFLEQLEKFEGILIATTNLIENLDSAFSRRFQHKIEFRRPGTAERLKLYQIHIPEKAPLSGDVNLQHLAEHYDLSGGQISVVVQNAAARAAKRGDGAISMADFIMACNEEVQGNFDERVRSKVGF